MLLAKTEIGVLLDTIQKQQQQFSELQEHISLDSTVPITFTKVSFHRFDYVGKLHDKKRFK